MKKPDNKTAFITGGLSGIVMVCAFAAIKKGANVAGNEFQSIFI